MTKTKKLDKDHTIEYEKKEIQNKDGESIVTTSIDECVDLQNKGYFVVNIYRVDGIKHYVLTK